MARAQWTNLLEGRLGDPDAVVEGLPLVIGAAHRRFWVGEDDDGDRVRAVRWVGDAVRALADARPALAAVLDWWLATADEQAQVIGPAWEIHGLLPGPLGEALLQLLGSPHAVSNVRRQLLIAPLLQQLERLASKNPGRLPGEIGLFEVANADCRYILGLAMSGFGPFKTLVLSQTRPATDLVKAGLPEGSPAWTASMRQLGLRGDALRKAMRLWPVPGEPLAVELPPRWPELVTAATGSPIAAELVRDIVGHPNPRAAFPVEPVRRALADVGLDDCTAGFRIAREAWAEDPSRAPIWFRERLRSVGKVCAMIDGAIKAGASPSEGQMLQAQAKAEGRISEGEAFARRAQATAAEAARAKQMEERVAVAQGRVGLLRSHGFAVPALEGDPSAWLELVDAAWAELRRWVTAEYGWCVTRVSATDARGRETELEGLERVKRAVQEDDLSGACEAAAFARTVIERKLVEQATWLGPEFTALRDRAFLLKGKGPQEITLGLRKVRLREVIGLPVEPMLTELRGLLEGMERGELPAALCRTLPNGKLERLAWLPLGIPAHGEEERPVKLRIRQGGIVGPDAEAAAARVAAMLPFLEVLPENLPECGPVFVRSGGAAFGPWERSGGAVRAPEPGGFIAATTADRLRKVCSNIEIADGTEVLAWPASCVELLAAGASLQEALNDPQVLGWLAAATDGIPTPDALRAWEASLAGLPDPLAQARRAHLPPDALRLAEARAAAMRAYTEAHPPVPPVDEAAIAAEVEAQTAPLRAPLAELRAELGRVEAEACAAAEADAAALAALAAEHAELEALLAARTRHLVAPPAPPPEPSSPLGAQPFVPGRAPGLASLVRDVAGSTWNPDDVANLVLSMATGRWTLLAGLPGVGKSTFLRSVLARLGHGVGSGRYLELVVRRDWQDDAPLFGFWHPSEQRWVPSSEGFVEHLLRASGAVAAGGDPGLWPVVLEELNTASPEHYLARPISAFEAASPEVRLYDATLAPRNAGRYPPSLRVPDCVRVAATVNVDDTLERLSPRFLSRASVLRVEASADVPAWRAEDDAPRHAVGWDALAGMCADEADLGKVGALVQHLLDQRLPGAPTTRSQRAIARFLAASRPVLPRLLAEDLQILQRVLPAIRGTGPVWRERLDRLAGLLDQHGWVRSATYTRALRERGEEQGDWYDFFHG